MVNSFALAFLALVPLVAGTSAHEAPDDNAMTVSLCNGGTITIGLGRDRDKPDRDCHQKGCHAGTCREKQKLKAQLPI